jgi:outer membrane protein TolC
MIKRDNGKKKDVSRTTSWRDLGQQELQARIQQKAFELYEQRGYSHGSDLSDWLKAERVIKSSK